MQAESVSRGPGRVVAIDHVQLAMPAGGEGAAREFYAGLLGLREVPKPAELAARGGAWFEDDGVKVHLGVEAEFRPARKAHLALRVDDLDAIIERLRAAGATVSATEPLGDAMRVYAFDPFGNRLELIEGGT